MIRMACLWMAAAVCAAAQGVVEGSVVDYASGNGIAGAKVEIVPMSTSSGPANDPAAGRASLTLQLFEGKAADSAVTDEHGRFRVEGVKEGVYGARYSAPGYEEITGLAGNEPWPVHQFTVTASGPVELEARMVQLAKISGRVVDDKGKPVAHAVVDTSTGGLAGGLDTNANGKFQTAVMPGTEYTLAVSPPPGLKPPDPEPETGRVLGWTRTYYPGVAAESAAEKIVLAPGGEMDVELKLATAPVHAVRGVVLRPGGKPAAKMTITLQENPFTRNFELVTKADGTFEFPAVVDGNWWLMAITGAAETAQWAVQPVEVAGHDVEKLKLQMTQVFTVPGNVVMDVPKGWTAPQAPPVRLVPVGGSSRFGGPTVVGYVGQDGNFTLTHVYPGLFRLDSTETVAGYYLDEMRVGGARLEGWEVRLAPGIGPLTLVYKADGGTVRGTVENCAGGGVLLVPQDAALRGRASGHSTRCDENGRYEITAVKPGDYYAVAIAGNPLSPIWVPKFDDAMAKRASEVTVKARERATVDLSAGR